MSYTKLKIKGASMQSLLSVRKSNLWLEEDHFLHVEGRGLIFTFWEHYQRLYFENIKGIIILTTKLYLIHSVSYSLIGLFFLLLGVGSSLLVSDNLTKWIVILVVGAIGTLFLIRGIFIGLFRKSCKFLILTNVAAIEIPSLNTMRVAENTEKILSGFIEKAQGKLDQEGLKKVIEIEKSDL
ncbi:MAG: hypothetical protein AAGA18_06725 [Verrucomicrobiota bacterium]